MSELSEFFIKKAKDELGEDEYKKVQSIQLFRDWLKKHPYIKFQEIDDDEILKYIRTKKYSMAKVFKSFEKVCCFIKQHPEFGINTEDEYKKYIKLFEKGLASVMSKRDENGAAILIYNWRRFEENHLTYEELLKMTAAMHISLENEPETPIGGIIMIHDLRKVSLEYFSSLPFMKHSESKEMTEYFPFRVKKAYVIGLPSFFTVIFNAVMSLMSAKHQQRTRLIKDELELHKYIDKSILNEEYGGDLKNSDCIASFKKILEKNTEKVVNFKNKFEIDFSKVKEVEGENELVGSFRKLEVD